MAKSLDDLRDLGAKPNWVSTLAKDPSHKMDPWPMIGDLAATKNRIKEIVRSERGAKLVLEGPLSLEFEFTTLIMRFTDDVVFVVDEAKKSVQFSSASRVGYSDLGKNRSRMEELTKLYLAR